LSTVRYSVPNALREQDVSVFKGKLGVRIQVDLSERAKWQLSNEQVNIQESFKKLII